MYPEAGRIKARKNAVEWLIEKLEKAVSANPPRSSDQEAASKSCLESIASIEGVLHKKFGEDFAGFQNVTALLEEPTLATSVPVSSPDGAVVRSRDAASGGSADVLQSLRKAVDLVRVAARTERGR
jgi:hypothetical protein